MGLYSKEEERKNYEFARKNPKIAEKIVKVCFGLHSEEVGDQSKPFFERWKNKVGLLTTYHKMSKSAPPQTDRERAYDALYKSFQLFNQLGGRVLGIDKDLLLMLKSTEVRGMTSEFIRTPLECQYIELPNDVVEMEFPDGSLYYIKGFFVTMKESRLHYVALGEDAYSELICLEGKINCTGDLDEQVRKMNSFNQEFLKLAFNILLYLTAHWSQVKWAELESSKVILTGKNKNRQREYLRKKEVIRGFITGITVISKREKEAYESSEEERKKMCLVLVRGHWRSQHYGSGSLLTKLIWIQPFWRGDEELGISKKNYIVPKEGEVERIDFKQEAI